MARYVSRSSKYMIGIGEPTIALVNGIEMETSRKKIAKFQHGAALAHEIEIALKTFTFKGLPDGVPPETRISVFDTRDAQKAFRWTDEEREHVEKTLDESPDYGVMFIRVDEIRAPAPFPAFDKLPVDKLIDFVVAAEVDPQAAIQYEIENQNRAEVVEALEKLGAEAPAIGVELPGLALAEDTEVVVKA